MQVRSRRDLIAGLVVAGAGVAYFAETFRIRTTTDAVGPETFPMLVGAALTVLGLVIAIGSMRSRAPIDLEAAFDTVAGEGGPDQGVAAAVSTARETAAAETAAQEERAAQEAAAPEAAAPDGAAGLDDADDEPDEDPPVDVVRLLVCFGLFAVYALVLIPVGFLVASAVFLFVVTSLYRPEKWLRNAIYSVVFTTILYFGFKDGLGVFLPPGILG